MLAATQTNPTSLGYTKSHEWVRDDGNQMVTIGITAHAAEQLGDVVFVDLPELDSEVSVGAEIAVIESVKTAADIYAPVSGRIVAINDHLQNTPEDVNNDPFDQGWLCQIELSDNKDLVALLSADDYTAQIEQD